MSLGLGLVGVGVGVGVRELRGNYRAQGVRAAISDGGSTRPSDPETRHAASLGVETKG